MKRPYWGVLGVIALALLLVDQRHAQADAITGMVSLDTSALSSPFRGAFVFIDGSGTGDANNMITLNNFRFGGGTVGAVDSTLTMGGVSGDLVSGVSLVDSSFFNVFVSSFMPRSLLSFDFNLTANPNAGGAPDQFSFALLGPDGTPVPTRDPSGADALLTVVIDLPNPEFTVFASDLTPAPMVTTSVVSEPTSLLLLTIGLLAVWSARRRTHLPAISNPWRTIL